MMFFDNSLYGNYRTRTFSEIFPNVNVFTEEYTTSGLAYDFKEDTLKKLYYLLYARYGNSPISSADENRFKYNMYSIIYTHGPTWEKKLEIQKNLRELSDDDLMYGAKAIYNSATNPSTGLGVDSMTGKPIELGYVNQQNTTNYKKSKIEAYSILYDVLRDDITTFFINRFQSLFNPFGSELPLYYVTVEE